MRIKGERQPQMDADGEARAGHSGGGVVGVIRAIRVIRDNPRSRQVAMRPCTGAWPYGRMYGRKILRPNEGTELAEFAGRQSEPFQGQLIKEIMAIYAVYIVQYIFISRLFEPIV